MWIKVLSIFLILLSFTCPRDLDDIKKSGKIIFATRLKKTIFYTNEEGTNGFHYEMTRLFAQRLELTPEYRIVKIGDYFKVDYNDQVLLLTNVDVFADSLTVTYDRKKISDFIPIGNIVEVIVYNKESRISSLSDLPKYKTAVAKGSSYEDIVKKLKRQVDSELKVETVETTDEQISMLLAKKIDYIILDSDQAVYYANRHKDLYINGDILSRTAQLKNIGWVIDRKSDRLNKELKKFVSAIRKDRTIDQLWQRNYGTALKKYHNILAVVDEAGTDLFKKSLDLALQKKYDQSLKLFQQARELKFVSEDMQKLYDRLYLSWLKEEHEKEDGNPYKILDSYVKSEPSRDALEELSKDYPEMYEGYVDEVKSMRDDMVIEEDITNQIKHQELIVYMEPDSFEELNTLRKMRMQLEYAKQGDVEFDTDGIETEVEDEVVVDEVLTEDVDFDELLDQIEDEEIEAAEVPENISLGPATNLEETNVRAVIVKQPVEEVVDEVPIEKLKEIDEKEVEKYEGERLFLEAVKLFNLKDYDKAEENFYGAKSLNYKVPECDRYLKRIEDIRLARLKEEEQRRLREFNEYFNSAVKNYTSDEFEMALDDILKALNIFPENKMAKKYFSLISEALRLLGEAKIDVSSPYYSYYLVKMNEADELMRDARYIIAKSVYEEVLNYFPHNEKAREMLLISSYKNNPTEFKTELDRLYNEGVLLIQNKNLKQARKMLQLVKKMDPHYPGIDESLKKTVPKKAEPPKKVTTYNRITGEETTVNREREHKKAIKLYQDGRLRDALVIYRKLVKLFPGDTQAMLNASRIENELASKGGSGRKPKVDSARRQRAENFYLKGKFYFRIKEYNKAIEQWKKAYAADNTFRKALIDIKRVQKLIK